MRMCAVRYVVGAALGVGTLIGCGLRAPSAQAAYIVTLTQEGANVVATGSGTIDTSGLNILADYYNYSYIDSAGATIVTGPVSKTPISIYNGFSGPTSFGSGGITDASSGSGNLVGIEGAGPLLFLPPLYNSGSALSDSATYDNQTFTSLGLTPGSYTWTWGSGADADSFTLDVAAAPAPGPASIVTIRA